MELKIQNVGVIKDSTVKLDGLTIVCGQNNSGKSTAGKALYSVIESLCNLEEKLHNELTSNYKRVLVSVIRLLDLDTVYNYVDFEKLQETYQKNIVLLLRDSFYHYKHLYDTENIVDSFLQLKDMVSFLDVEKLLDFPRKPRITLTRKLTAFLENYEENRKKALILLDDLSKYYFEPDLHAFAEESAATLFSAEFKGQIFPVNLKAKDRKSNIILSKNGEIGCDLSIIEGKKVSAIVRSLKLFMTNAIYIEDPYALDKVMDDDDYPMYRVTRKFYNKHEDKLNKLLLKKDNKSIIEQTINENKYDDIVDKFNRVIPGTLIFRDSGVYYEEKNKEPLRVQNLATGSKMFSIIKTLLEKGEINFDTMLILDEPESHLHPEWQNALAEIIVLLVKELDSKILLTTHSPNFLMAIEAYSNKYELNDIVNYYMVKHIDNYLVNYELVNERLSEIYTTFAKPLVDVRRLKNN